MSVIKRVGAVEASVQVLQEMVAAGRWHDRLPGTRVLASLLGVSQPTAQQALTELAKLGILEPSGERRAYRIKERGRKAVAAPEAQVKRLIVVSHQPIDLIADTTRQTVEALQRLLVTNGWQVERKVIDFFHARTPHQSWDNLIGADQGERVVAVFGRPSLAQWAINRKVRMLFLGGVTDGLPVPVIAVKSSELLGEAYQKLIALGHRRIVTPLCDRPDAFKDRLKEETKVRLESAGFPYSPAYHNPESEYLKPEVTWSILEGLFKRERPTALVLLDWRELVTASCFLMKIGLRVPEDVSLVLLNDQSNAEWFQPALARFRFPIARMARKVKAWAEEKWEPEVRNNVPAEWIPGDSIGPAPKR